MDQLPTWNDVKLFFKTSWKTISVTMVAFFLLYGAALWYTVRSQSEIASDQEVTSGGVALKGITREEYQALKEDEVTFSFYVENNDDTPFLNYNLLKTVLLSPTVFPEMTKELDLAYEVPDAYVLNISRDNMNVLYLNVGTGNYGENLALANRIYDALDKKELDFLSEKSVYLLNNPRKVPVEEQQETAGTSDIQPSSVNYVLLGILGLFLSFIGGVFIAVLQSFFQKEFALPTIVHFKDAEQVINLNALNKIENRSEYLKYSILHSKYPGRKLVLIQEDVEELIGQLSNENVLVVQSLLNVLSEEKFVEAVMVIKQKQTEKKWYKNQSILLKNYQIPLKIILL